MAEAVGAASAITTFVTLALQAAILLDQTIKSFQSRDKIIRELRNELQELQGVLQALDELIRKFDVDLQVLQLPLKRCGNACSEFNKLIAGYTRHSTEERVSKRDWFKIRYMGEDISGFKDMLAGYKSTVTIALAYANLRTIKITEGVLKEYKELIQNTQCDLENHLDDIRTRLESSSLKGSPTTEIHAADLQRMEDEKQCTQKGLDICQRFLDFMNQSRSSLLGDFEHTTRELHRPYTIPPSQSSLINAEGFNSAHKELMSWKISLYQYLSEVDKQFPAQKVDFAPLQRDQTSDSRTFQDEVRGTEALLTFCKQAEKAANKQRINYYEDIAVGDNTRLAVVTTFKDLISAKHIKSGNGSCIALGQMSDDSIQNVFSCRAPSNAEKIE
ncbi:hypothetical protein BDV38DRAFT_283738 [Aspergillus pseudotamarii]|uniref:Azaphilone pigments biosynthesis cluster protein L N-terminal domain-containing protein n=1 Tax=Aspergillus pseudotamarii TaxID=132259 RepID=A0A5N6SSN0_ASPPS|nr:uncharacterized protein BDV38DRAFT_283738 [Aspergillus pseudotamarii]KAE8136801.1 hypothetical protein BDV38DRAFT_283738 [Aspergillus pseudotamarii]